MRTIWRTIYLGFWQGIGLELSFLLLWLSWMFLHSKIAHKLDPEHFFHKLHDYFTQ